MSLERVVEILARLDPVDARRLLREIRTDDPVLASEIAQDLASIRWVLQTAESDDFQQILRGLDRASAAVLVSMLPPERLRAEPALARLAASGPSGFSPGDPEWMSAEARLGRVVREAMGPGRRVSLPDCPRRSAPPGPVRALLASPVLAEKTATDLLLFGPPAGEVDLGLAPAGALDGPPLAPLHAFAIPEQRGGMLLQRLWRDRCLALLPPDLRGRPAELDVRVRSRGNPMAWDRLCLRTRGGPVSPTLADLPPRPVWEWEQFDIASAPQDGLILSLRVRVGGRLLEGEYEVRLRCLSCGAVIDHEIAMFSGGGSLARLFPGGHGGRWLLQLAGKDAVFLERHLPGPDEPIPPLPAPEHTRQVSPGECASVRLPVPWEGPLLAWTLVPESVRPEAWDLLNARQAPPPNLEGERPQGQELVPPAPRVEGARRFEIAHVGRDRVAGIHVPLRLTEVERPLVLWAFGMQQGEMRAAGVRLDVRPPKTLLIFPPRTHQPADRAGTWVVLPDRGMEEVTTDRRTIPLSQATPLEHPSGLPVFALDLDVGERVMGDSTPAKSSTSGPLPVRRYEPLFWLPHPPGREERSSPWRCTDWDGFCLDLIPRIVFGYPAWCGIQTSAMIAGLWWLHERRASLDDDLFARVERQLDFAWGRMQALWIPPQFVIWEGARPNVETNRYILAQLRSLAGSENPISAELRMAARYQADLGVRSWELAPLDRRLRPVTPPTNDTELGGAFEAASTPQQVENLRRIYRRVRHPGDFSSLIAAAWAGSAPGTGPRRLESPPSMWTRWLRWVRGSSAIPRTLSADPLALGSAFATSYGALCHLPALVDLHHAQTASPTDSPFPREVWIRPMTTSEVAAASLPFQREIERAVRAVRVQFVTPGRLHLGHTYRLRIEGVKGCSLMIGLDCSDLFEIPEMAGYTPARVGDMLLYPLFPDQTELTLVPCRPGRTRLVVRVYDFRSFETSARFDLGAVEVSAARGGV
ncbi:MAG: hypothetical protein HYY93_15655 [Planctomycetes bacterium]|nr:hypothetical protein [Planctomycetota bacterium]